MHYYLRDLTGRLASALRWRAHDRAVWEAICAITHDESDGRRSTPSPYVARADLDWMVITGVNALSRGDDARLAMIDAADPIRGSLHSLHIEQVERWAAIVETVFVKHFPRRPAS